MNADVRAMLMLSPDGARIVPGSQTTLTAMIKPP